MTITPGKTAGAAQAGGVLIAYHAEMQEVLDHWAAALAAAAADGRPARPVRNLLRAFLADEVLPHTAAEERTLYRAGRRSPGASRLLPELTGEHRVLSAMTSKLGEPARPADLAAQAAAISALFAGHVAKENSLLLPALEQSGADLAALLAREPRLAHGQWAA
jgi:hypothetical protein